MKLAINRLPEFAREVNRDAPWSWCLNPDGTRIRKHNHDVKNIPLPAAWEQFSGDWFRETLTSIGSDVRPKVLPVVPDRVYSFSFGGITYIIGADGKISQEKGEHVPDAYGLKIHIGVNQCPDSILGCAYDKKSQFGRQPDQLNGTKILCFDLFLNYGFNEDFTYTIKHYGIAWIPYATEFDIEGAGGKSPSEMRMWLKDRRLFRIHSFVAESVPQTQDSVPSSSTEPQAAEPLIQ
jgi:hypothetical protein